ncbi:MULTISPECIES: DNA-binding protein [Dickeya]|jgi:predicted transcriptional regulator|uniref:DNA-binding protein n=2 Tax=Dickeya TaxID=204037 RepID=A0ABX9WXD2_9GAMM|nr:MULTISPECIES: DNA-binding protein [Dickeya]MCA6993673.1 DNA-binding protein [Dickeya oryzae]RNM26730.1 DNA-binding protein [Dickeya undicola]UAY94960.1 DNA-binding protein [Dickeya dadantii]UMB75366.1 DNA-binding protein [Dickeya fangzhongdai]
MDKPLSITLATPYITLQEFSRLSGVPMSTCYEWVHQGKLPIREKTAKKERVLVNILALTKEADLLSRLPAL